jgi:hypothetical protein
VDSPYPLLPAVCITTVDSRTSQLLRHPVKQIQRPLEVKWKKRNNTRVIMRNDREKKFGAQQGFEPWTARKVLSRGITQSEHRTTRPLGHNDGDLK